MPTILLVGPYRTWDDGPRPIYGRLVEILDTKLWTWNPATAAHVRERVAEVIELADQDVLDLMRSRVSEQELLDLLASPPPGDVRLIESKHVGDAPRYRAKGLRR